VSDAQLFLIIHSTPRQRAAWKNEYQTGAGASFLEARRKQSSFTPLIRQEESETMQRIRSERTVRANLPFSDAVWHGGTLYLSGHIGIDPQTGKPGATPEEEARLVLDGVKRTLEAAGLTMDNLLSVQIFCSDVSLFERFNTVYRTYFLGEFPARAFLGSGRLLFDARFEVQGIAARS
jgi:2-iminobutanoate/2-iminopropanoate deaminase